jgi:RimJ/RimL family protein N-acetyltransferase
MIVVETERLRLRTIDAEDAAFYYQLVNDPTWLAHIGDKGIRTIDQARTAIIDGPMAMQLHYGHSLYVMERKDDGQAIGLCGLIRRDILPDVDLGYAIRPAYFGQGYTLEAAQAVLALARDRFGITRVLAITAPANTHSINVLAQLGLRFVEAKALPPGGRMTNIYQIEFAI